MSKQFLVDGPFLCYIHSENIANKQAKASCQLQKHPDLLFLEKRSKTVSSQIKKIGSKIKKQERVGEVTSYQSSPSIEPLGSLTDLDMDK